MTRASPVIAPCLVLPCTAVSRVPSSVLDTSAARCRDAITRQARGLSSEAHPREETVHRALDTTAAAVEDMRGDHCRRNIAMAEECLHGPDVVPGLEKM
jgi:hypothetical protein